MRSAPPALGVPRVPAWFLGALLLLTTVLAYQPVWRAGFIWDDDAYVTRNAMLTAPDGLRQIWFSAHRQSQYFPMVYTTLRLERTLWGLNPQGYHAVNLLMHALNVLLLWQLVRRLKVPGAWLAAAIFALHPVQVESVAWITELKNVQSTFFYLLAVLAWVSFIEKPAVPRWGFYWLALLLHALALFSKTTACTLPAALLLILWWRREPIGWRRILQILPFVLMGLAMGLVSVWWEGHLDNYVPGSGVELNLPERLLVATRALWFYAGKLFWPVNLTFSYPRWDINLHAPLQYLGLAGCAGVGLMLWWRHRAWGRGFLAGAVFFVAALSPLLGFIPLYTFLYSFVADHYQYLACAGLIVPFAALISSRTMSQQLGCVFCWCLPGCLLLVLGALTWNQAHVYVDEKALWQDTVTKNPASWMAHYGLANAFLRENQVDQAIAEYRETLRLRPQFGAYYNLGNVLLKRGQVEEAIHDFRESVRLKPDYAEGHYNLANTLMKQGRMTEAIHHFKEAIRLKPGDVEAHNNLANVFARVGQTDDAIAQYQEAVRLKPDYAEAHYNLGVIILHQGRVDEAVGQFQEALRVKPDFLAARKSLEALLATRTKPPAAAPPLPPQ